MATSFARPAPAHSVRGQLPFHDSCMAFRRVRHVGTLVVSLFLLVTATFAAPASAEAPSRLDEQITDSAGVVGGDLGTVESALSALQSDRGITLWVAFVPTFDGLSPEQWSAQTASQSGFGTTDALLAVAVEDSEYQLRYEGSSYSEDELQAIATDSIAPALRTDDWSGAAVAAADGLRGESSSGSGSSGGGLALFGVIIVLAFSVLPVFLIIGGLAALATTEPWATLLIIGIIYIGSIPMSIRAYSRLRRAADEMRAANRGELVELEHPHSG